jgi:hypothetical protein
MSIITHHDPLRHGLCIEDKFRCIVCEREICRYPFLHWSADFCICGECCREIRFGLTADLIQIAAIKDIQDLTRDYRYRGETLVRGTTPHLEAEAKKEADAAAKALIDFQEKWS